MPKKSSTKVDENIKTLLNDVANHITFNCQNGETYKNLEDLKKALKDMNEETFRFHVGQNHNHFANWIYDIIGDIELADDIRHLFDQEKIRKKITSRITAIKRKLKAS